MYAAALAELGFAVLGEGEFEGDEYVLFGRDSSDDFSIHSVGSARPVATVQQLERTWPSPPRTQQLSTAGIGSP